MYVRDITISLKLYFVSGSIIEKETTNKEKEHAKIWFKLLHGGSVADTLTNLKDAASGENYEHTGYDGHSAAIPGYKPWCSDGVRAER